ncbi:glyoxalase [Cryomorpha ignava]|uniref:Glyoxalase n=1 Tax=Cryomorpha ignava TaxID=101383 RepID=A0A7K3WX38_9FLAO|nr:glyoxalase [Cryomorpha ignava]NEN25205.1 glyoxalase [Cryomorpha ignava]
MAVSENNEVLLCLHKWGSHEHPTVENRNIISGNGLVLYCKFDNINLVREKLQKMGWPVEEEIHLNSNSTKMEFSLRDLDGYDLTITEYHEYEG